MQEWDLVEDLTGNVEYPTRFSLFQNVSVLWVFIPDSHGADHTSLSYLGFSGVGTQHKRQAVMNCVYELRDVPDENDPIKKEVGGQMGL